MPTYAIRHTFPNGDTLGDGFIHSGNVHPQPVAPYDSHDEAQATAERMTTHNPGHTFEVVPYPAAPERYKPWPVAASVQGEHGPITVTRYVVVTPGGTFLTLKNGGETRTFKTMQAARSMAWRLNNLKG